VTASSLKAEALSCYGGPAGDGGSICALAEHGALFVWAFSTEPETAPAAATLLTSRPPSEHGVRSSAATFLATGTPTLATELRSAGYDTAAFVAVEELNRSRNFQGGFDTFEITAGGAPAEAARLAREAFAGWVEQRSDPERPWFGWVHFPGTTSAAKVGLSLAVLDAEVASVLQAAHSAPPGAPIGVAFGALRGTSSPDGPPLALERVRVPLIWAPAGGVAAQRLVAPVALLDLGVTGLQAAGRALPPASTGEPLRVAPLPPAAIQPARPLALRSGDEVGVVLSRRFYARPVGDAFARTALLSNDGQLPQSRRLSVQSGVAQPFEALLPPDHLQ